MSEYSQRFDRLGLFKAADDFMLPGEQCGRGTISACLDAVGLHTVSAEDSAVDRATLGIPEARKVCLVLVDGLGAHNLEARKELAPHIYSWWEDHHIITTIAPSTTSAAIPSMGTGMWPGATSMLSWSLRSTTTAKDFSLVSWSHSGEDPMKWQPEPSLFDLLGPDTLEACVVQAESFANSGLTQAAFRGALHLNGETFEERCQVGAQFLHDGGSFAYIYWDYLDHQGHHHGWESDEWEAELRHTDEVLVQLEQILPKGTLLVITADHGMIDVTHRTDYASEPGLQEGIDLFAGEQRSPHLYTHDPEGVQERWQNILGDTALVLRKDQIRDSGLYGPMSDHAYQVLGDVVAFQRDHAAVTDIRKFTHGHHPKRGTHGSLTQWEMEIPLIQHEVR